MTGLNSSADTPYDDVEREKTLVFFFLLCHKTFYSLLESQPDRLQLLQLERVMEALSAHV